MSEPSTLDTDNTITCKTSLELDHTIGFCSHAKHPLHYFPIINQNQSTNEINSDEKETEKNNFDEYIFVSGSNLSFVISEKTMCAVCRTWFFEQLRSPNPQKKYVFSCRLYG